MVQSLDHAICTWCKVQGVIWNPALQSQKWLISPTRHLGLICLREALTYISQCPVCVHLPMSCVYSAALRPNCIETHVLRML